MVIITGATILAKLAVPNKKVLTRPFLPNLESQAFFLLQLELQNKSIQRRDKRRCFRLGQNARGVGQWIWMWHPLRHQSSVVEAMKIVTPSMKLA